LLLAKFVNLLEFIFGGFKSFGTTLCEAVLPLPHTTIIMPLRLLELRLLQRLSSAEARRASFSEYFDLHFK
jgi:hypothetical protein